MTDKKHLAQPKALYDLFVIELWERFAYYGMQVLLVFFIEDYLHLSMLDRIELNGAFIALVYASPTFGGFLADKILGIKRTLLVGAVLLAFGYMFLAVIASSTVSHYLIGSPWYLYSFYWSLGCIAIGNGCFKPNPNSLLSKVYVPNDPRIDAGYTIFYMSINIGSLMSLILTPIINEQFGYVPAFMICSLGLIFGIGYFIVKLAEFKNIGVAADFQPLQWSKTCIVGLSIILLTGLAAFLLANLYYARVLIFTTVLFVVLMLSYFSYVLPKTEGNKILAILILLFFTAIFFSMQLQMFGVLNIFVNDHVLRNFMGYEIPAGNYAALNALWISILGPVIAKVYIHMEHKNIAVTIPTRVAAGLLIAASAFYLLSISHWFTTNGMISSWWIIVAYFIISLGEILVSALGLALICKLAPPKLTTMFFGAFLLSLAIGGWISGLVGHWIEIPKGTTDMQFMLTAYNAAFFKVGTMALVTGILAAVLVPFIVRLTGEKDKSPQPLSLGSGQGMSE